MWRYDLYLNSGMVVGYMGFAMATRALLSPNAAILKHHCEASFFSNLKLWVVPGEISIVTASPVFSQ